MNKIINNRSYKDILTSGIVDPQDSKIEFSHDMNKSKSTNHSFLRKTNNSEKNIFQTVNGSSPISENLKSLIKSSQPTINEKLSPYSIGTESTRAAPNKTRSLLENDFNKHKNVYTNYTCSNSSKDPNFSNYNMHYKLIPSRSDVENHFNKQIIPKCSTPVHSSRQLYNDDRIVMAQKLPSSSRNINNFNAPSRTIYVKSNSYLN